jgi:hypothetical protein
VIWLKAEHRIEQGKWPDASTWKNDAVSPAALQIPAPNGMINFNPALVFDGHDDRLTIPYNLESLAGFTVFAVFHCSDTTERGVWGIENAARRSILLTTRRAAGPDSVSELSGKSERIAVVNAMIQSWDGTSLSPATAWLTLGNAGPDKSFKPFQGSFAEFIVFDRALTFLERTQYETYLAIKYGTSLFNTNYVSAAEKVLWNANENSHYSNNIFGIGRDDLFKLYQKQSGAAYDSGLMVISAGPWMPDNHTNVSPIADGDFILLGDNGLPLVLQAGTGADSVLSFMQRKWLAKVTGSTVYKLPTELLIDVTKLRGDPMEYQLVIDRSALGNFSAGNLEFISPDRVKDGKLVFTKVSWDNDRSGSDVFGFARARDLFAVVRKLHQPDCTTPASGRVRIDIVSGTGPYALHLNNTSTGSSRQWTLDERSSDQHNLEAGNYTLLLTDASDETITSSFTLAVPGGLQFDLGDDMTLSPASEIILDVSSQIPDTTEVSYRWTNNYGFSSTDKRITVVESGIYNVNVTRSSDNCMFSDLIVISGSESQRITVYPSLLRSHQQYNVNVSLPEPGPVLIKVFDPRGTLSHQMEGINNAEYQFTGAAKDSGIYLVTIQTREGLETRKLIVH